jgi:hypothetical protein
MRRGPLRFLILAVGLWICARAAMLAPGWWTAQVAPPVSATSGAVRSASSQVPAPAPAPAAGTAPVATLAARDRPESRFLSRRAPASGSPLIVSAGIFEPAPTTLEPVATTPAPGWNERPVPTRRAGSHGRWTASAWLLVRNDPGGPALAPGGTLGGSQTGARVSYRLGGGFALSARGYLPLRRTAGAEAAAGLEWRPVAAIPVSILAERRQALGREGRSAFALTLHGGGSVALPRRLRLDAYGQAGIVGTRERDLFADGAVRLSAPVGPLEVGASLRGAAQPGATRLDAGPGLAYRLPLRGANVRIEAEWRWRVAGAAAPGSGPALTLATDF